MKIAIIDDDPIFQFVTWKMIDIISEGNELLRFDDGKAAFDFIQNSVQRPGLLPELILLDINMPHMNGWLFLDSLRTLKNANYHPLIYMVSSSIDQNDLSRLKDYIELKGYLNKPLTKLQLYTLLGKIALSDSEIG